jgi:GT2 family glycosyltransferase
MERDTTGVISVVIPARDAERSLPGTLGAVVGQGGVQEVIVVDNGSSDGTAEAARAAGARLISLERPGRAAARNRGAAEAVEGTIAFLDADCRPEPGWAAAIGGCLDAAPLVGGPVAIATSEAPGPSERFDALWRFQQERTIRDGRWAASANLAVTRAAFDQVGGFDEGYGSAEDVDFCIRAARLGLEIAYCPAAVVSHPASRSVREVLARGLRQGHESTRLHRRLDGQIGRHYWRRPGGIVRGEAALRALGVDPDTLGRRERRAMARIARAEYLARFAGSAAAQLRRA